MSKSKNVVVWVVTVLVAAVFLLSGATKLAGKAAAGFAQIGYPVWFSYVTGAIEAGAAVLLLVPRTASIGGALLVATMIGAVATHLKMADAIHAPPALILGVLSAFVAWERRPGLARGAPATPSGGSQGDEYPRAR